ncbi:23S rRNA pseudouridylate synthase [Methyloprofundus sedimenti]|uniref:Pseudouridine synthase n=1 Tax=Methyloprofundus sedimenti TaxID=1420851 RepID=A0A1V8M9U4_9GAMM|nr:23S rRNA pseudouridine(955/2504/2580) synthase RluC [Methyloprofundus sedimenti]OQK18262.1 23S rRNA pseudouridylate synthase [Methyloprofundus sedimenti]
MKLEDSKVIPKVQLKEITDAHEGQRLDNFLMNILKGVPKSHIYRIIRKGEVRINKGRCDAKHKLSIGDIVRIPPVRVTEEKQLVSAPAYLTASLTRDILFEDDAILVINKPSGFAVHGGSGISSGVIEALRELRPDSRFLELVHRLDRDTSGCLIIAKKRSTLRILHEYFRGDGVKKNYLALLHGRWEQQKIIVDQPLLKNISQGGERMVKISSSGKPSKTLFRRLALYHDTTLVEASPYTGRTHQIRVHAAWLGHAIIGDERYGENEINKDFRRRGYKRLFLHAHKLQFAHPISGEILKLIAPLPVDLQALLDKEK